MNGMQCPFCDRFIDPDIIHDHKVCPECWTVMDGWCKGMTKGELRQIAAEEPNNLDNQPTYLVA